MPFASAARTAQPGSRPCAQSANRHCAASASTSWNVDLETGVGLPELQLAHPRRVEHEPALGQRHELAVRRRVPAAAVLADVLRREQLLADERVDERRLADARRAEQRCRPSRRHVRAHRLDAVAVRRAHRVHGDAERDRLDLAATRLDVVAEVGLRQEHDRLRAALPARASGTARCGAR